MRYQPFVLAGTLLFAALWPRGVTAGDSGLPLPRFVSVKAERANMRAGPGLRYPVAWVFVRKGVPLEVVEEFDLWRRVRDIDGAGGWIHIQMLSGKRTIIVTGEQRNLYSAPNLEAPVIARAESGVQGRLLSCAGPWCRVELAGHRGWMQRHHLWGIYDDEQVE